MFVFQSVRFMCEEAPTSGSKGGASLFRWRLVGHVSI